MQIDLKKYEKLDAMLDDFSGGKNVSAFSQELSNRVKFATNFMKALSDIEIKDEVVESINTLMDLILSYEISIFDLYEYCGTLDIDAEKLINFFAHYTEYFNKRKSTLLEQIYLSITSDTISDNPRSALLDVIHKIKNVYLVNTTCRIVPTIKFSYIIPENNSYFINDLSAANNFYSSTNIKYKIHAQVADLKNSELRLFHKNIISSYDNKDCSLYKFSQKSDLYKMLLFVNNFNTNHSSSSDIFYSNIFIEDVSDLLRRLSEDIYKLYMNDIVKYENRNKPFKPDLYYSLLNVADIDSITADNYKYEFFKAMIKSGSQSIITQYNSEILKIKKYLKNIYSAALSDNRYRMGE